MAACTFCAIVAGEHDAEVVAEDELTVAFLIDIARFAAYTLVKLPGPYETLADLPPDLLAPLFGRAASCRG